MGATTFGGHTSDDVCDAAGISYRQLDYWTRTGLITPIGDGCPGSGWQRRWTAREVRVTAAVGRLMELGARHDTLRHVAPQLRAMAAEEWHGELLVSKSGRVAHLTARAPASFGEACWVLNLDLCAMRAEAA